LNLITLFKALNWSTVIGNLSSGIKKTTPSEQGGVVRDPEYMNELMEVLVKREVIALRSRDGRVTDKPGYEMLGRWLTIVSRKVRPQPLDS